MARVSREPRRVLPRFARVVVVGRRRLDGGAHRSPYVIFLENVLETDLPWKITFIDPDARFPFMVFATFH